MNIRNIARATFMRLAILVAILVVLTLFINLPWFDEELHADLVQLTPPREVSMDGNAYPLVYGFLAAEDHDPRQAGERIIQRLRERFEAGKHATLDAGELDEILGHPGPAPAWSELYNSLTCNPRVELDCADRLIDEMASTQVDDPRLRLLLERFEQMLAAPRFEENQEIDVLTPLPPYGPLISASRIRLAKDFHDDTVTQYLLDIGKDIRFWKHMLGGGQTLIAKMIALAGLRNDTLYLSTLMRSRQLTEDELRRMPAILAPLTESERNIEETFLAELRIGRLSQSPATETLRGVLSPLRLATQENATANEYYLATTVPLRLRASLSAAEFYRQRAYEPLSYPMRFLPPPLYNLGGKLQLRNTMNNINWQDYITRVHDLDGRIALVLLQAEIALNPDRSVPDVLMASRYRNPYTGAPMDHDPGSATIGFPCLAIGKDVCAVRIR